MTDIDNDLFVETDLAPPGETPGRRPILIAALAVGFVLIVLIAILARGRSAEQTTSPILGLVAPPIVGETLAGGTYDLDLERGNWVVVNFFTPTCVPCVVEHPELIKFNTNGGPFGNAGVVSVPFATREMDAIDFFETHGGDWPVITGDTGPIVLDYVTAQVPESFIVDPTGRVVAKLIGGVTERQLNEVIINASAPASPVNGGQPDGALKEIDSGSRTSVSRNAGSGTSGS